MSMKGALLSQLLMMASVMGGLVFAILQLTKTTAVSWAWICVPAVLIVVAFASFGYSVLRDFRR